MTMTTSALRMLDLNITTQINFRTVKILQNAFSHISCRFPQNLDRAEKLEANATRFSRQCAVQTLPIGFWMKAFRKFITTL